MLFGLSTKAISAIASSIVLVGVVFGTAAVLAKNDDFGTIDAPQWESGNAWTYDVTGSLDGAVTFNGLTQQSDSIDLPTMQIKKEILNTKDFSNGGEDLYIGATTLPLGHILDMGMFTLSDSIWENVKVVPTADRQRDLAPILAYPVTDCNSDCEAVDIAFGKDLGIDYIKFPIENGDSWKARTSFSDQLPGMSELEQLGDITEVELVGEVGKMETISLPVGDVDAVRLDFSYKPVGIDRAIAQVREQAEAQGITIERLNLQIGLHEIAHYSPDHEAVVRDQFIFKGVLDVAGDAFGQEIDLYAEFTGFVVAELTGSTLASQDERSLQQILDIINDRAPIHDATGVVLTEEDLYDIEVVGDMTHLDATIGESVLFTIQSDTPGGQLPDGHSYMYALVDGFGTVHEEGFTDDRFLVYFDDPGVYTLVAAAVDGAGQAVSIDSFQVVANFRQETPAVCTTDATRWTGDCGHAIVPARAGLESATIVVSVNETVMDLTGQDYIELVDDNGRVFPAYRGSDGDFRMQLTGEEVAAAYNDAVLRYVPAFGLDSEVLYSVDLQYSGEAVGVVHGEENFGFMAAMGDWEYMGPIMASFDAMLDDLASGSVPQSLDISALLL